MSVYRGSCHCGAVAFEVEGELRELDVCNCSICTKRGYLHWEVPQSSLRLSTGWDAIATYTFNTGVAKHYFCRTCGVAPFYVPRSAPDCYSVNARCLEGVDLDALPRTHFDGQHWEEAFEAARQRRQSTR